MQMKEVRIDSRRQARVSVVHDRVGVNVLRCYIVDAAAAIRRIGEDVELPVPDHGLERAVDGHRVVQELIWKLQRSLEFSFE